MTNLTPGYVRTTRVRAGTIPTVTTMTQPTGQYMLSINRRSEMLGQIDSKGPLKTLAFAINPANPQIFPWLSKASSGYTYYRFRDLCFEYRGFSSQALGGAAALQSVGRIQMGIDDEWHPDNYQPSIVEVAQLQGAVSGAPYAPSLKTFYDLSRSGDNRAFKNRYVLPKGGVPPGNDPLLYHMGIFFHQVSGCPTTGQNIGEMWVHYSVDLIRPKHNDFNVQHQAMAVGAQASGANGALLGPVGGRAQVMANGCNMDVSPGSHIRGYSSLLGDDVDCVDDNSMDDPEEQSQPQLLYSQTDNANEGETRVMLPEGSHKVTVLWNGIDSVGQQMPYLKPKLNGNAKLITDINDTAPTGYFHNVDEGSASSVLEFLVEITDPIKDSIDWIVGPGTWNAWTASAVDIFTETLGALTSFLPASFLLAKRMNAAAIGTQHEATIQKHYEKFRKHTQEYRSEVSGATWDATNLFVNSSNHTFYRISSPDDNTILVATSYTPADIVRSDPTNHNRLLFNTNHRGRFLLEVMHNGLGASGVIQISASTNIANSHQNNYLDDQGIFTSKYTCVFTKIVNDPASITLSCTATIVATKVAILITKLEDLDPLVPNLGHTITGSSIPWIST